MQAIDFANSYMTWFPRGQGTIARIQLDAACTIVDDKTDESELFYLIAPCRSENMYLDTNLFKMPNYEFCGIWSENESLAIRTHWVSDRDNREYRRNRERWEDVHLDVRTFAHTRQLSDSVEIIEATLDNRPLIARTELHNEKRALRAVLEYPIKTMNIMKEPARFQVDTGPLIVPDFSCTVKHTIKWFEIAYVAYNTFDKAEFVLCRPTPIPESDRPLCWTTDYSLVRVTPACNQILCAM